ncbi:HEAT repeat domain-containing protein [Brachyspira aalborgi]|uniref:HEAT repeat domain-containing protein n=1 Tax=Brachyspira aalborgi TaxID=29522 RepID=A0A5C8GFY9_9SPIR|nr:HEAT repeat domain-containing protein [Brachyspira aalborgi]TXJ12877.1 HEAT repeat domain-containing protein [Brachyspira aalborgi]TXJ53334.1 HEAT repeat domain-containing protein [Brachyspira aalborgi]TXJ60679.1 HEAT repeat domain-containing protein [Brachyspira aalborgi]
MLKKIFTLIFILVFSTVSIFAQEESEDSANKPREALLKDFVDALASQDESLLLSAIEMGSPEVKALCFQALSESGASSDLLIQAINRYVGYGLSSTYPSNSDSEVRYQALKAAKSSASESSVQAISSMLYAERETFNIIAAIQALGEIGDAKAVPSLLFQLRLGRTQGIVYEAAVALGKIGDASSLSDLVYLAQDDRYFLAVRQAAIDAIRNINPPSENSQE